MIPSNPVLKNASGNNSAASQLLFFEIIFAHMTTRPDVDWDAVAAKAGYGTPLIARNRFSTIIRKPKSVNDGSPPTASPSKSQSGKSTKAKEKHILHDGSQMSPSKVAKHKLAARKKKGGENDFETGQVVSMEGGVMKKEAPLKEECLFEEMMMDMVENKKGDSDARYP
ncbi:hypothetical protein BDZ45DRAFT_804318 [Acephala macrosclerotiorum]|nr:hypothetical protein BDZ45DRAFT_804318 [Acephala macrosclerotiorum]